MGFMILSISGAVGVSGLAWGAGFGVGGWVKGIRGRFMEKVSKQQCGKRPAAMVVNSSRNSHHEFLSEDEFNLGLYSLDRP